MNIEIPIISLTSGNKNGYSTISDDSSHNESNKDLQSDVVIENLIKENNKRKKYAFFGIFISILLLCFVALSNWTIPSSNLLLGSTLDRSISFKQVIHPDQPTPLWGNILKPYPTGAFWTNFVVKEGDGVVGVMPYGMKIVDKGIQISYGATRRVVTQSFVSDPFFIDLQLSATQSYVSHNAESYDNSSVTMAFKTAGGGKYKTHVVKGSPFVTVVYENTTPVISSDLMTILDVQSQVFKGLTSVQYIVTLGNYQKWLLYCSEPIAFIWKNNTLTGSSSIHGFIRVAILPPQSSSEAFKLLMNYVRRYPTGAVWSFTYPNVNKVDVNVQYTTVGSGQLLMLALPHQSRIMQFPSISSPEVLSLHKVYFPIYSIKGIMELVVGETWKLEYDMVQVGWNYQPSDPLSTSQMDEIAKSLIVDIHETISIASDPYAFGKQIARIARLALIADEFGISTIRKLAINNLENYLTPWLTGSNPNALVYDKTWGGIVPTHGLESNVNEFGAGWYSDHHFHYGYMIYAIATITKLNNAFWVTYRSAMEAIIRDVCNPDSGDSDFPFFRHVDLFDGHSWASGLFKQGNGKGQESSSESLNAYYSAYLYGLASGNAELTKAAQTILSIEMHSTKVYWHMSDDSLYEIYDPIFAANRVLGNIGAIDITASTWFGSKFEFVHGINMMPLTPITSVLFDQKFVKSQWPILASRLAAEHNTVPEDVRKCSANKECQAAGLIGNCCPNNENDYLQCCKFNAEDMGFDVISDQWKSYIRAFQAIIDRNAAWKALMELPTFGSGGSRTNSLYFAATRSIPPKNYTFVPQAPNFLDLIPTSCKNNSACNAIGMFGECCPIKTGDISLGCCSRYVAPTKW